MNSLEIECVGYSIAADWYEGKNSEVLLVLPGYTSSKAKYARLVEGIVEKSSSNALVIDYTGHGESPFEISDLRPAQNFLDVVAAYDWLTTKYPGLSINVMGTSYGGYFAAILCKYRRVNKLVLRVPAIYPENTFYTKWKEISRPHAIEYRNSSDKVSANPIIKNLTAFKGRSFVVEHELDDICPKATTDAFIKALRADSWVAPGLHHSFYESKPSKDQENEYQQKIADWLNN